MALVVLVLFGSLAACLYLLMQGKAITTDGRMVAAGEQVGGGKRINGSPQGNAPAAKEPAANDPVMGNLGQPEPWPEKSDERPKDGDSGAVTGGSGLPQPPQPGDTDSAGMDGDDSEGNMAAGPASDADMESGAADSTSSMEPEVAPGEAAEEMEPDTGGVGDGASDVNTATDVGESMEAEPTSDAVQADDAGMADDAGAEWEPPVELVDLLRSGRYRGMQATAETLAAAEATPTAQQAMAPYVRLAELAEYYDEGVRRGAAQLGATETFELADGLEVIVVESSRERISIKVNGRVRGYSLDAVPLVLAHRLASFALPSDDRAAIAARAAYQLLWPDATPGHREQALDWWAEVEGEPGLASVDEMRAIAEALFE